MSAKVPVGAIFRFRDIPKNAATRKVLGSRDMRGLEGMIIGKDQGKAIVRVDGVPFPQEVGVYGSSGWRVDIDRIEIVESP